MDEPFTRPLSKLRESGIGVAADPSAGQGLALDLNGKLSPSLLIGYPNDAADFLHGDGSWSGVEGTQIAFHVGSSPPASPANGMLWIYNGVSGIYWQFVYDSSEATNKWKFVGGPPILASVVTQEGTASGSYVDLATTGPSITLARAGDYIFRFSSQMFNGTATDGGIAAVKIGAAATADADGDAGISATANQSINLVTELSKAVGAGDVCKLQYKVVTGGTANFLRRVLSVTPVRVI